MGLAVTTMIKPKKKFIAMIETRNLSTDRRGETNIDLK